MPRDCALVNAKAGTKGFTQGLFETCWSEVDAADRCLDDDDNRHNKRRALARQEWLQLLVRIAMRKLLRTCLPDTPVLSFFEVPEEGAVKRNRYGDLKKSPRLVEHLMTKVAPMFADRDGGYTRIVKLDKHRLGDGTDLVLLQLVGQEDGPQVGSGTSSRRQQADRRTAFAAKLAEGFAPAATAVAEDEAPAEEPAAEETASDDSEEKSEG